jgi:CubicO group peptidase (beta-lactamase class C family)
MKSKILVPLFLALLIANSSYGQSISLDTLDQHMEKLMKYYSTPGVAIAIVENGEIQYSKGFGTRTINKNEPVDENTLFAIGSISKSFIPLALAMLVDEGKTDWDDKVIKYLPYFQLYAPYVTNLVKSF